MYFTGLLLLIGGMLLLWIIGVQVFSPILIPVLAALTIRYAYLIRYYNSSL